MPPHLNRPPPPYMQITDHYRAQIQDGFLGEGIRLPSVAAIATEWNVAHATAAKAVAQLQVEGLITTSPRGSFVTAQGAKATTPRDRLTRAHRSGRTSSPRETHHVNAAELVVAPTYVAELFALEPGGRVVRREWVTVEDGNARDLTVTWYPAEFAEKAWMLSTSPASVGGILRGVEAVAGPVTRGRDFMHARAADAREASALGLPIGSPILAGTWLAWAGDRLMEYGEYCLPPRHTLTYDYEVPDWDIPQDVDI